MKAFLRMPFGALVLALALLLPGGRARASDTLFDNFGPSDSYQTSIGWTVSGSSSLVRQEFDTACAFTFGGSNHTLDSLQVAAGYVSGTNSLIVKLMTDASGLPGSVLESFTLTGLGPFGSANPPLTATSVLHPLLTAGQQYWVALFPGAADTWAPWNLNSTGQTGGFTQSLDGGSTWPTASTNIGGAFRVLGSVSENPVPEPSSLLLLASGLPLLRMARRRRSG